MLKRLFPLMLAVAVLFTGIIQVSAAQAFGYEGEAKVLNDLGLYNGISTTEFVPDLGTALNRESGVVMLLRIFGLEADAERFVDADATLAKFSDAASISSWAKNAIAYAVQNGLVQGLPDGTFAPKAALNGKAYCTLILRQIGFTPDFGNAPEELADRGGLTEDEAVKFTDKNLIKDDLVGISFGTLSATDSEGKKVIDTLVDSGVVEDENVALDAGLLTVDPLNIKTCEAIGNNTVEVLLNAPASSVDISPVNLSLTDSKGNIQKISNVSLAGWSKDNSDLLVTLENSLESGALYTIKSGENSAVFTGRVFKTIPNLVDVSSVQYNKISLQFDAPVNLEGLSVKIYNASGLKVELSTSGKAYLDKNTITFITEEQKSETYEITISGVSDFSGNKAKTDLVKTFMGKAKDTRALELEGAYCNEPETVLLKFNVNVDEATVLVSSFTVSEKYGAKRCIPVIEIRSASEGDLDETGAILTKSTTQRYVIIKTSGMRSSTLYGVKTQNLKSYCGISLSADHNEKTFAGLAKPSQPFSYTVKNVASSNSIILDFSNRLLKEDATKLTNYTINEAYGTKQSLNVISAELGSDGKTVILTTAPMKTVLYKLTVSGIDDIYGNKIDTLNAKNTVSFAGKAASEPIRAITGIEVYSASQISVRLDKSVGDNATDVANYSISDGIGHPYSVTKVSDDKVMLSIKETTGNATYKLTVSNLVNTDGIPMEQSDISAYFTGYYEAPPAPSPTAPSGASEPTNSPTPTPTDTPPSTETPTPTDSPAPQVSLEVTNDDGMPLSLVESYLNDSRIMLTVTGDAFSLTLTTGDFQLNNAPAGLFIGGIERPSDTQVILSLIFNNNADFDVDIPDFSITVRGLISGLEITSPPILIEAEVEQVS